MVSIPLLIPRIRSPLPSPSRRYRIHPPSRHRDRNRGTGSSRCREPAAAEETLKEESRTSKGHSAARSPWMMMMMRDFRPCISSIPIKLPIQKYEWLFDAVNSIVREQADSFYSKLQEILDNVTLQCYMNVYIWLIIYDIFICEIYFPHLSNHVLF